MNIKIFIKNRLFVCLLLQISLSSFAQNKPFEGEIKAFAKSDSIVAPLQGKIVFAGSSSFAKWKDINQYFPGYPIINRGFGGSNLLDVILYVNETITKYKPKQVVIYCGENDITSSNGVTGKIVLERFRLLYLHIREKFPTTDIYYISLKPCPLKWEMRERILDANYRIADFCKKQKHTYFISIWNQMLINSKPNPSLFINDSLHMNIKGYEIWTKEIRKKVKIN